MPIIWCVVLAVCLIVEAETVALVSIWFAVGALAGVICSLLGGAMWLQFVLFFVLSAVLLAAFRPMARKYFTPKLQKTNLDLVVGSQGVVTEEIPGDGTGRVKLGGLYWAAKSTSGQPIPENAQVRVDRVEGVKVFVSLAEEMSHQEVTL